MNTELYRRVDEVTHYIWDPIGVAHVPEARDEYKSYLTAIHGRVKSGKIELVIEYMKLIVTEEMSLQFDESTAQRAAKIMIEWREMLEGEN